MIRGKKFDTKQLLVLTSIVLATWLFVAGLWFPNDFIMSFADSSQHHAILRGVVIFGLFVIFLSKPPRSNTVRMMLGVLSTVILVGACGSMIDYHVGPLDALLYLQVSIILALEAIEPHPAPVNFAPAQSIRQ